MISLEKGVILLKTIKELYLGFSDAQNYSKRKYKEFFINIFVRNSFLEELLDDNIYFLIGEKGTGKTAYATFLSNSEYKSTRSITSFIDSTDYEKFYALKNKNDLELTEYTEIWKVILLLLLSKYIYDNKSLVRWYGKSKLNDIVKTIDKYYSNAFSPDIQTVMKVFDESAEIAKIVSKFGEVGESASSKIEYEETKFQNNLYYIEKNFSDSISKLKLNKNVILFIDGIDIRPDKIPYTDYIECIKGLARAAWSLNTDLFSNIKDSKGNFKVILLLRPDIFNSLNLQNSTNKLLDNSVFLDWRTTYNAYKKSELYLVANKILSYEQEKSEVDIFESYFPWKTASTSPERNADTAFMEFLRISLSRPRDILVIMQYLKKNMEKEGLGHQEVFDKKIFDSDEFQNMYSEYFMSSLKDQLSFYYSNADYELFLKLFDFFKNANFTYEEYLYIYNSFMQYVKDNTNAIPEFIGDNKKLLQLLYDSNIIAAIENSEGGKYYHFSYREKNNANISPKVPQGENISYRFHYGLYKKAKMGRY